MIRRRHDEPAVLITSAPQSSDEEYDRRRKKYAIMMGLRALCVIGAGVTYRASIAVALVFVVGGLVLPWCAVLIANDRPAKKRSADIGYYPGNPDRALMPGPDDRTVDG